MFSGKENERNMSISREFTGKTTEEAIDRGLQEMQVTSLDVNIDILQEGSKGLFGLFGSRPAKVRLTLREANPDARELVQELFAEQAPKEKKPHEPEEARPRKEPVKKDENRPARPRNESPKPQKAEKPEKPVQETAPKKAPAEEPAKAAEPAAEKKPRTRGEKSRTQPQDKPEGGKPARKKAARPKPEAAPVEPAEQADRSTQAGVAQEFLQELTRLMGVNVSVAVETDPEGNVRVNMEGDTLGILIGRRGETLDALQYLTSLKINKGRSEYTRVTLDTEHYRARREEALVRLANRMANRVQKTGRKVSMEPMNPYERRILHSALQNNDFVMTHSEGEEPNRHVVITPKKADKGAKGAQAAEEAPAVEEAVVTAVEETVVAVAEEAAVSAAAETAPAADGE